MAVQNVLWMARDIRPADTLESYAIKLKGLVKGRQYKLSLEPSKETPGLALWDNNKMTSIFGNFDYYFYATDSVKTLSIKTWGAK